MEWDLILEKRYGVTGPQYLEIFSRQNGLCAICFLPENNQKLAVDHDHKTGKVRGLLCKLCNRALGGFKDDPARLRNAALYLEKNS